MAWSDIYFIITKNCNLKCSHCYLSAGPSQPSISFDDFKRVIKNLPKRVCYLSLTGGEVFTRKELLYNCLNFLQNINKKGKGRFEVGVQTNGSWATDDESAKSVLHDLLNLGVSSIDIPSYDRYHAEQGLNQKKLKKLEKIIQEDGQQLADDFELRGADYKRVMPFGRAGSMPSEHWHFRDPYNECKHSLDDYDLSIAQDGKVYMCCYNIFPLPGNAIHEPLVDMVKRARKSKLLKRVNEEGVRGFAYSLGLSRKETTKGIKKYGECGFCARLYLQNSQKLSDGMNLQEAKVK